MKHKLLIIDDTLSRHDLYRKVLNPAYFELFFVEDPTKDIPLVRKTYSGYVIDLVLPPIWKDLIDMIDKKNPSILVSNKWEDASNALNNYKEFKLIHFFGWDEFIFESRENIEIGETRSTTISNKLLFELNKFYNFNGEPKEPDETIRILHVSDLQFGDPSFSHHSFLLMDNIATFLREKKYDIDLIIISGDITYSALPTQYNSAQTAIDRLCTNIFSFSNYQDRIILVPGNHDVSLNINAIDNYSLNKEIFNKERKVEINNILEDNTNKTNEFSELRFIPYQLFVSNLTNNSNSIVSSKCIINDNFANWGIRFIQLNSSENLTIQKPYDYRISDESILAMSESKSPFDDRNLFTIVVSHHGPNHLGEDLDGNKPYWTHLLNLLALKDAKLFLNGHSHGGQTLALPHSLGNDKLFISVQAGTLSLNNFANQDDSRNFLIIELNRSEGNVIAVKGIPCEIRRNNIVALKSLDIIK